MMDAHVIIFLPGALHRQAAAGDDEEDNDDDAIV
jgi:hypothetical protein